MKTILITLLSIIICMSANSAEFFQYDGFELELQYLDLNLGSDDHVTSSKDEHYLRKGYSGTTELDYGIALCLKGRVDITRFQINEKLSLEISISPGPMIIAAEDVKSHIQTDSVKIYSGLKWYGAQVTGRIGIVYENIFMGYRTDFLYLGGVFGDERYNHNEPKEETWSWYNTQGFEIEVPGKNGLTGVAFATFGDEVQVFGLGIRYGIK
jgi:hypothetical protein